MSIITITTKSHVNVKAFVSAILESRYETYPHYGATSFVGNWSLDHLPIDHNVPYVIIETVSPDDEDFFVPNTLSINDLARAYEIEVEGGTETWEDVDADFGDRIIQNAIYGELVYA